MPWTQEEKNPKKNQKKKTQGKRLLMSLLGLSLHSQLDSAFQLQEHLAALHHHHTSAGTQAITREAAIQLAQPPPGIERTIWLYELCRFLISQCNSLIVGFLFDGPPCSATTCPEMRASEWQFLCAVHEQPKSCCAIDYCCHTLDWAANVVSDQKLFPSRFAVLNDASQSKNASIKNLINVFRRLHRIFAHAWFQHRGVFWSVESQTGLYILFKLVCDLYDLLPAENYKLPPEAEGLQSQPLEPETGNPAPTILKPPSQQQRVQNPLLEDDNMHPAGRTNTRRHIRSSPSTGSSVTTVMEAEEEDSEHVSSRLRNLHLAGHHEPEVAEVPVIVEHSAMAGATNESNAVGPSFSPLDTNPATDTSEDADGTVSEAEDADDPEEPPVDTSGAQELSEPKSAETSTDQSAAKTTDEAAKSAVSETAALSSIDCEGVSSNETKQRDMTAESGQVTDPE